jgi:hypothetical protein
MRTYSVFWSPEGRKIATVQAKDARAAIRKAPKPYRKYLGELYAVDATEPNAWKATIALESEGFLLGGGRIHESSAFFEWDSAKAFAAQSVQVNRDRPGYADAKITVQIVPVYSKNPIPA